MDRWTFEVPGPAEEAHGLEGYSARDPSGERVGKVAAVLRRGHAWYVLVDHAVLPGAHDYAAHPWDGVARIDHSDLAVYLRPGGALALETGDAVERGPADAARVTELPPELTRARPPEAPGPVDRGRWILPGSFALLASFASLAVLAVGGLRGFGGWWWLLVLVPIALWVASFAAVAGFAVDPYERRRRRTGRAF